MQTVSPTLEARLATKARKPAVCIEFYAPDYDVPVGGFDPDDAVERFSIITLDWGGIDYRRELKSVPTCKKAVGKERNSTSLSFSNLDRYIATLVVENSLESCWAVIRIGERDITDSSIVWFVGKLDKPGDVDQPSGSLTAKEALGSVTQQTPWRDYSPQCPLVPVYHVEGEDCVGFKEDGAGGRIALTLAEKPAAYLTHDDCPGSFAACQARENEKFFQGIHYQPIPGSFLYNVPEQHRFLLLFHRNRTRVVQGQYSNSDNTPYDTPIPQVLGRAQIESVPLIFADEGANLVGWYAWAEGKLTAVLNIRNNTPGFSQPFAVGTQLGDYGGLYGQIQIEHLGFLGPWLSRLAYSSLAVNGSAFDVVDSSPVISGVGVGEYPLPDDDGNFTLAGPTDNPALLTRFILTDHHELKHPAALIDDAETLTTAALCDGPVIDDSNGEVSPVPTALVPDAGTRFHRYLSTGVRDANYYRRLIEGDTIDDWWEREADLVDEADVPDLIAPIRYLRKRYTLNMLIGERVSALDLLYDTILPSFRGYLVTSATGRIQIKTERPADNTYLVKDRSVGVSTLYVDDVTAWKDSLQGKILIGAHLVTSEVREVILATYASDGNSITLATAATGAPTLTASGATLTGGSTTVQASGTFTVGGAAEPGAQIQAIIDGLTATYTFTDNDTTGSAAALLADTINADPTLSRIVVAAWDVDDPNVITVKAKLGILTLDSPLTYAHDTAEECIRVLFVFNAANIKKGSFKWPGSNTQQYNRIEVNYRNASRDFAKETVRIDDKDNQALVNKTNTLKIDGAGIDSYHQAYRIGLAAAGKYFDGNKQASWETRDGLALLIEEGDVGCVTDSSSGLVNYPVRAKTLNLNANLSVGITADAYATAHYLDVVPETTIKIPSTLLGLPPSQTTLKLFNSWPMRDADIALGGLSTPGFYAPAGLPSGTTAWPGAEVWIDRGSGYTKLADIPAESVIGKAVFALPTATAGVWDMAHTVTVDLNRPDKTLPSGTLSRPVRIRLGTETIDYVTATQSSTTPNRWVLSGGLLRGQARTEDQVATHLTDEQFILIDESVPYILVEPQDIGVARNFKIIQRGTHPQTLAEVSAVSFTVIGLPIPPDITSVSHSIVDGQIETIWTAIDENNTPDFKSYVVYDGSNVEKDRPRQHKYIEPVPTGTPGASYVFTRKVKVVLLGDRLSAGYATTTASYIPFLAPSVFYKGSTAQEIRLLIDRNTSETQGEELIKQTVVEVWDSSLTTQLDAFAYPGLRGQFQYATQYSVNSAVRFKVYFKHKFPVNDGAKTTTSTRGLAPLTATDIAAAPPTDPGMLFVSGATSSVPGKFIKPLIVYATTAGAIGDYNESTNTGTDNTTVLRSILARASATTPIHLIIDGPMLTNYLTVKSYTTIEILAGGSLNLKNGVNRALIRNANPSATTITDEHITIIGGRYFGNNTHQTGLGPEHTHESDGTLIDCIQMFGVRYLRIEDVEVAHAKAIAIHCSNLEHFYINDIEIDNNDVGQQQQGGVQIEGPAKYFTISNIRGTTQDDLVALSLNGDGYISGGYDLGPYVGHGDITDGLVDTVIGWNALRAARVFGTSNVLDRVKFKHLFGTYTASIWSNNPQGTGTPHTGSIEISGVDARVLPSSPVSNPALADIEIFGTAKSVVIDKININDPGDARLLFLVDSEADIQHLHLGKFTINDTDPASLGMIPALIAGRVRRFTYDEWAWNRSPELPQASDFLRVEGVVDQLLGRGALMNNVKNFIYYRPSARMFLCQLAGVQQLDAGGGASLLVESTYGLEDLIVSNWHGQNALPVRESGGTVLRKRGDAFPSDTAAPTLVSVTANDTGYLVFATISKPINASAYAEGFKIRKWGVVQPVIWAMRQPRVNTVIEFRLANPIPPGATVTIEYDAPPGNVASLANVPLATFAATAVTLSESAYVYDELNAADGTALSGRTPDLTIGSTWAVEHGSGAVQTISKNRGQLDDLSATGQMLSIDATVSDTTISTVLECLRLDDSANSTMGVFVRATDYQNYIAFFLTANNIYLVKYVAGVATVLGSASRGMLTNHRFRLALKASAANLLTATMNDTVLFAVTDSFNSTATKCGVRAFKSLVAFDNLLITSPTALPPPPTNYAASYNGATATASSDAGAGFYATFANDGNRRTSSGGTDYWAGNKPGTLTVDFGASRTITEIDVYTHSTWSAIDPTNTETFSVYGATDYTVEYWNGSIWVNIATVTSNNLVWKRFTFAAITTTKIRVNVTGASDAYARIVEVEAYA